eukprot:8609202-Lingulodinium_polyedra.AAC.1
MACASVRLASRCGRIQSTRPHRCEAGVNRYTVMPSNRTYVVTAARKSHAHALRARASFGVR